jgi:hypothetical protein
MKYAYWGLAIGLVVGVLNVLTVHLTASNATNFLQTQFTVPVLAGFGIGGGVDFFAG